MASAEKKSTSRSLALCVRNDEYEVSLELRKLYTSLPDRLGEKHGLIRVVDESGEDYLYPADYFVPVVLHHP
jgi:hypothetical protein